MEIDNLVTLDYLAFGFVAKGNYLLVTYLTDIKSSESRNNNFLSLGQSSNRFFEKSINSFLDSFLVKRTFLETIPVRVCFVIFFINLLGSINDNVD